MKSLSIGLIGLVAFSFNAWAGTPALQGIVKDTKGQPVKGAEVRIEGKNFAKTTKADAKGHYFVDGLTAGTNYRVSVVVNGSVKGAVTNVRARAEKPTDLNFAVKSAKKHMVWVPDPPTGTHIGPSGHWVEVDDNGLPVGNTPNQDVQKMDSNYAKQLELSGTRAMINK